jgi:hypothetical protein
LPRIAWLSFAALRKTHAAWTSDIASARYRLTIPAQALGNLGCDSIIIDATAGMDPLRLLKRIGRPDAAVFGKLVAPPHEFTLLAPKVLQLADTLARQGVRIVADFSDDGFREQVRRPYFRGLANSAHKVVASTEELAKVLRDETASAVRVVTDPVEGQRGSPVVSPGTPLRLLWYGHPTNLSTLSLGIPQLVAVANRVPIAITLITSAGRAAEVQVREAGRLPQATCRLVPWTPSAVFDALKTCDAVLIPSDPDERRRAVKSPNRFLEAVWAGRFVVAHPLPSYLPLAAFGWVGDDIGEGLEWLLQNPAGALERIRAGQMAIEANYVPPAVAAQWKAAILGG